MPLPAPLAAAGPAPAAAPQVPDGSPTTPGAAPLASVAPGTSGVLALGRVPRRTGLRLAQLGLRPGTGVTVLSRTAGDGRLVGVGTGRIGLDRDTSRLLELRIAPGPRAPLPSAGSAA